MPETIEEVQCNTVVLERIKKGLRYHIPNSYLAHSVEFRRMEDSALKCMVFTLIAEVLGRTVDRQETTVSHNYISNWWQAFKDRWFPDWLKRQFPVTYTNWSQKVEFKVREEYPHMIHIPEKYTGSVVLRWATEKLFPETFKIDPCREGWESF